MATQQIFLSYRRDDAAGYARAIGDALGRRFGAERVFIDVDDIAAGQAFGTVIAEAVDSARVLLVLIGPRWLGPREGRPSRIHDPDDLVRREVADGLARGLQVIPLLLDGTPMPGAAQLPEALQPLTGRNALAIDNGRFAADMARLADVLQPLVDGPAAAPAPPAVPSPAAPSAAAGGSHRRSWVLAGLALLLGAGIWFSLRGPYGVGAARPAINGPWSAAARYDWPNADFVEHFEFDGEGAALQGSASYLRVARPIEAGHVDDAGLRFVTRSTETLGESSRETEHRYRGTLVGDELQLTMQTVGSSTPHALVRFVARRASGPAVTASR